MSVAILQTFHNMEKKITTANKVKSSSQRSLGFVHSLKGKMNVVVSLMLLFFVGIVFSSCDKDDALNHPTTEQSDLNQSTSLTMTRAPSTVTYYSTPGVGGFSPNSSSEVKLGNITKHHGGVIKAQVLKQNGNRFTIRISKQNGGRFSGDGLAYVSIGSVDAYPAGHSQCLQGSSYVDVDVSVNFSQGYVHLYPIFRSIQSKERYYAEPILVYTLPMYSNNFVLGKTLGVANGVEVKCNNNGNNMHGKNTYQCVQFCKRYYSQIYKKELGSFHDHARNLFDLAQSKGLVSIKNGSAPPRVGDILCFDKGSKDDKGQYNGHVAIIMEVADSYIAIAQQNSGDGSSKNPAWYPIGGRITRNGNSLVAPRGFEIQGWIRLPTN